MVFMCLSLSVFSTIEEYEARTSVVLFYMETVVVVWFAIEFFLRFVLSFTCFCFTFLINILAIINLLLDIGPSQILPR